MKHTLPMFFALFLSLAGIVRAGPGEQVEVWRDSAGGSYLNGYLEYLPPTYDGTKLFPLVIFNHGLGDSGTSAETVGKSDLQKVDDLAGDPPNTIKYNINHGISNIDAIVISPQLMPWANLSRGFVDFLIAKYRVDTNRIYMTGLSMGGGTTWNFARANPNLLAAIVPVCGQPNDAPTGVQGMANLPIWAFHNDNDPVVDCQSTTVAWVTAITTCGGTPVPLMTIYNSALHNCWSATYARQDMWDWMFAQSRAPAAPAPALELAANGVTDYVIVQPDNPSPADAYAVQVLAAYLQQKTAVAFPVVSSQAVNGHKQICVGLSAATVTDLGANPIAALADQQFVARTVGNNIYLYGKSLHGNLYAVVDFLDTTLERRWFVDGDTPAPAVAGTLTLAPFSRTTTPSFRYGMLGFPTTLNYQHGCNVGFNEELKAAWGLPAGMVPALDNRAWAHTTFLYIPPTVGTGFPWLQNKGYFTSHPDWFSMNPTGQRVAAQLCFSAPGLRAELTTNILDHIQRIKQENLGLPILISLEQEDASTGKLCHCPGCAALDATYASNAGAFFDYLRSVASTVQALHPDVMIKIMAYRSSQTQPPPTMPAGTTFPTNVVVEFCSVEDVLNRTWDDPRNSSTYQDLCGWTALSPHVWAWRYYLYGAGLMMPFSNIARMEREMEMMKAAGVEGTMLELYPEGGFTDVLQYLYLRFARNALADADDLLTEFCQNQFGPAAAEALAYINEVEATSQTGARDMDIIHVNVDFDGAFSYLTDARIRSWQGYFDTMVSLAGSDTRFQRNIRLLRRSLDFATLGKWRSLAAAYPDYFVDYTVLTNRIGAVNTIRKPVLDDWVLKIQAGGVYNPLPPSFPSFPAGSVIERVPLNTSFSDPVRNVLDATAAFGYAATVNLPNMPFDVSFYRQDAGVVGPSLSIGLSGITPDAWTIYHLGEITLSPNCGIFFGGGWMTILDLGPSFQPTGGNQYDAYVSLKFKGASYGGQGADVVLCDRVILVDKTPQALPVIRLTTGTTNIPGWQYDQPYVTTQTRGWGNNTAFDIQGYWPTITGTTNQALYSVERWGTFGYAIPVTNGTYTVTLHFAELYYFSAGAQLFDVAMEGVTALDNFDIVAEAGSRFKAIQRAFDVTVTDGVLNIDFQGVVHDAKVSAIEVARKPKSAQTITFTALAARTYGDAPVVLGATASSGLPVTCSSDNSAVAVVNGSAITITGAGSAVITACQAGNDGFEPAASVARTLTVAKKTLTAAADAKTRPCGADNPAFTVTLNGFVDGDNAAVLDSLPIANCAATAASSPGAYPITVSGGTDNNYAFSYVDGLLTVGATAGGAVIRLTTGTNAIPGWEYDEPYVATQTRGWGNNSAFDIQGYWPAIAGTTNQALYSVERWGTFGYAIPVTNGTYTVTLHFAELYYFSAGAQVFDVAMEGVTALDNFDIVAEAGGRFKAIQRAFDVTVADGVLNIDFQGVVHDAKVSAIEVAPKVDRTLRLTTGTSIIIAGWECDEPYVATQTRGWGNNTAFDIQGYWPLIAGTTNQSLYSVERWGTFGYAIPVDDGVYTVTLHFAELYYLSAGAQLFDVVMEGVTALDNFDIVAEAGGRFKAIQRAFEVTVTDGVLNIDFQGVLHDAKVSAIEISPL